MSHFTILLGKAKRAYAQKRFLYAAYLRLKPYLYGLRYLVSNRWGKTVSIHCPDYIEPSQDEKEVEIVNRIFRSFRKMKEGQKDAPGCYLPSSQWQEYLEHYSLLNAGLKSNDVNKFHYFLTNFGTWKEYHAVESTTLITDNVESLIRRRYLQNEVFYNQLRIWR
jgi:hypothetical protein